MLLLLTALFVAAGCDSAGVEKTPTYEVSGTIVNVSDRSVDGATVTLQPSGSSSAAQQSHLTSARPTYETTVNAEGEYRFDEVEAGTYTLTITYPGYTPTSFEITIEGNKTLGEEVLRGPANVTGVVVNAQTGDPVVGATVSFNDGAGTSLEAADLVADTGTGGIFTINGAPTGTFVCVIRIEGFFDNIIRGIEFTEGEVELGTAASSPGLGEAQLRIVLTWGETPEDLDSHLTGPDGSRGRFHVYYANQNVTNATLDVDDVTSYGPETITIATWEEGDVYRYSVHNYSNRLSDDAAVGLNDSPALVQVYGQSGLIRSYSPPGASAGDGDTWRVFELSYSSGSFVINDANGETLGYFSAGSPGDTGTFLRTGSDGKVPLAEGTREVF